jgi:DNA-binding XRE family transcriptional regulator
MPNWNELNDRAKRASILSKIVGKEVGKEALTALETAEAVNEAARFLRQMRETAELTQQQLGEKLGVSQARICELERGGKPEGMSYALLRRAAIACGFREWPAPPQSEHRMAVRHRDENWKA